VRELARVVAKVVVRVVARVAVTEATARTDRSALVVASDLRVVAADPHAHAVVRTLRARMTLVFVPAVSATTIAATAIGRGAPMATVR